jgi:hypothetical protein
MLAHRSRLMLMSRRRQFIDYRAPLESEPHQPHPPPPCIIYIGAPGLCSPCTSSALEAPNRGILDRWGAWDGQSANMNGVPAKRYHPPTVKTDTARRNTRKLSPNSGWSRTCLPPHARGVWSDPDQICAPKFTRLLPISCEDCKAHVIGGDGMPTLR